MYVPILTEKDTWFKDYRAAEKWNEVSASTSIFTVSAKVSWEKFGTLDVANMQTRSECEFEIEINKI